MVKCQYFKFVGINKVIIDLCWCDIVQFICIQCNCYILVQRYGWGVVFYGDGGIVEIVVVIYIGNGKYYQVFVYIFVVKCSVVQYYIFNVVCIGRISIYFIYSEVF